MQPPARKSARAGLGVGVQVYLFVSIALNLYVLTRLSYTRNNDASATARYAAADSFTNRKLITSSAPVASAIGTASTSSSSSSLVAEDAHARRDGEPEVWAKGPSNSLDARLADQVKKLLSQQELSDLRALCGRCLFQTATQSLEVRGIGGSVFVATGDIPDEWIRDGSVQLAVYLPRIAQHPVLRPVVEGAIRTQAYYILSDPWANSYRQTWARTESMSKFERQIGRGGWIATRNFEVDSGAYFFNLLWNYAHTEGVWSPESFLRDQLIHDAVSVMVATWITEQHHEERSPYRYAELPREGKGAETGYTGMIWAGFRPSDDPNTYGYNVPVNMYAAGALERIVSLNAWVWRDAALGARAQKLADDVVSGIDKYGVVLEGGKPSYYAYEVDGLGKQLHSFDDPNIPSLLSMPLLGYNHFDQDMYDRTRSRILSPANSHYYVGSQLRGCGSPHTPRNSVWSLAHCVQALTAGSNITERLDIFRQLLKMQGNNGLMHESNDVNSPGSLTRPLFQWANTMFVVLYEQTFGEDCGKVAEELRIEHVKQREGREHQMPRNGGPDLAAYYERLEQDIKHVAA